MNKRNDPAHTQYYAMLQRCRDYPNRPRKDYVGNSVDPKWLDYPCYLEWVTTQIGFLNREANGRLYSLDKDFLCHGNRLYSAETCVFIPNALNVFIKPLSKTRELPRGVYRGKKYTFKALIRHEDKLKHLGAFTCPDEAHKAYCAAKETLAKELAVKYQGLVDQRVIDALNQFKVQ